MARTAYVLALSQDYEDAYAKLLDLLPGRAKVSVTVFWPMRGERYDGDLMVIGQAPRKWFVSLGGAEMSNPNVRRAKLADARAVSEVTVDTRSQRWVPRYWSDLAGSPFWKCIRSVVEPDRGEHWPLWLCYSNLYKAAPAAGANPNDALKEVQRSGAITLLGLELREYAPRRVLVVAGRDWFEPFARALGVDVAPVTGGTWVSGVARDGSRSYVVTEYPLRAAPELFAEDVAAAFRELGATVPSQPVSQLATRLSAAGKRGWKEDYLFIRDVVDQGPKMIRQIKDLIGNDKAAMAVLRWARSGEGRKWYAVEWDGRTTDDTPVRVTSRNGRRATYLATHIMSNLYAPKNR